ncbi:MAG: fibronectin type III domain-containing protein [Candidatus Hatepunaea meridiana]|nr:fibronectin type III domain-containing protein [Candidatus Hatepunaea meridiana]
MKRFSFLLIFLFPIFLLGIIGCNGDDDDGPSGPTLDPPSNLSAVALSNSEVELTWVDRSSGAAGFIVERSTDGVNWLGIAEIEAGGTGYTNSGLSEGKVYHYRIKAKIGSDMSVATEPVSVTTLPITPEDLVMTNVTGSMIELSWSDESDVEDGYNLERKLESAEDFTSIAELDANSITCQDTDVEADKVYIYRIQATIGDIASEWSNELTVSVIMGPSDFAAIVVSCSEIGLTWTDNSMVETGFRLERKAGTGDWVVAANLDADVVSYNDTGLEEATNYSYQVIGILEDGESDPSNIATATTMLISPVNLTATKEENNPTIINLLWEEASNAEDGFELQRKLGAEGQYMGLINLPENTTSYTDPNTTANSTYYYRLRAIASGDIISEWSNEISIITTILTPQAPSDLELEALSYYQVKLNWQDNSDNELGFVINRSFFRFEGYSVIDTVSLDQTEYIDDEDLTALTSYYYHVYAFNADGASNLSNIVRITTLEGPPGAPQSLTIEEFSYTHVKLNWMDTADNEEGFVIEKSLSGDNWEELVRLSADSSWCFDFDVEQLTTYYYRIYAFNYVGNSDYSNSVEISTPLAPPATPTSLRLDEGWENNPTIEMVAIEWDDNSEDELGFKLYRRLPPSMAWAEIAELENDEDDFIDENVDPSTTYNYYVIAYNDAGNSGFSNEFSVTTPMLPPVAPEQLEAEPAGLTEIQLSWRTEGRTETHFIIERRDEEDGEFIEIGQSPRWAYSFNDMDLEPDDVTYWYRVKAVNSGGISDYSNIAEATTPSLLIIDDDFEDYDVDGVPDGIWSVTGGAGASASITDEDFHSEEKSVYFTDTTDANAQLQAIDFFPIRDGVFDYWFKIKLGGYFGLATWVGANVGFAESFFPDSTLCNWNGGGYDVIGRFDIDEEWIHITFNLEDGNFTMLFDDEVIIEDQRMVSVGPISEIWFFTFTGAASNTEDAWVDDVHLEIIVPEEDQGLRGPLRTLEVPAVKNIPPGLFNIISPSK